MPKKDNGRKQSQFAAVRKSMNLTQEELAQLISETRQRISAWENGKESPWMRPLFRIASKLGVEHTALIEPPENYTDGEPKSIRTIASALKGQYDRCDIYIQFRWEKDKLYMSDHVDGVLEIEGNPLADLVLDIPVYAYQIISAQQYNDTIASTPHNDSRYVWEDDLKILVLLVWPGNVTREMIPMNYSGNSPYPHY